MEGIALLAEGVPAASVEQAALQAGYPVGPLAVTDEVTLTLGRKVRVEARKAGVDMPVHPGEVVVDRMLDEFDRPGKSSGRGFYDYPADGSGKRLWPGWPTPSGRSCRRRWTCARCRTGMLFAEVLESVRCLDEGVLTGVADANIGSIFGIGFPAWTGGVLQFIETYDGRRGRLRRPGPGAGRPATATASPHPPRWPPAPDMQGHLGYRRRGTRCP